MGRSIVVSWNECVKDDVASSNFFYKCGDNGDYDLLALKCGSPISNGDRLNMLGMLRVDCEWVVRQWLPEKLKEEGWFVAGACRVRFEKQQDALLHALHTECNVASTRLLAEEVAFRQTLEARKAEAAEKREKAAAKRRREERAKAKAAADGAAKANQSRARRRKRRGGRRRRREEVQGGGGIVHASRIPTSPS